MRISPACLPAAVLLLVVLPPGFCGAEQPPWIRLAEDGRRFVLDSSGETFRPWGFNYDHDRGGRLLEDYWQDEWPTIAEDFGEMKGLGANVVRIHLQFGRFMDSPREANQAALDRLAKLVKLAARTGLYLDLTGLGCYHKQDVPGWYDALSQRKRWDAQAAFWEAVAGTCAGSPAVFCYDLMNEPVVPGGNKPRTDWLGPGFAGKYFVQFITLDRAGRDRADIARQWIGHLVAAIRRKDTRHLVTVGLVPWSLDRPGLTSGFVPDRIAGELDFLAVHIYPQRGKVAEAIGTLRGFDVGKPVLIEETFPLKCGLDDFRRFLDESRPHAAGLIGFYWGRTAEECGRGHTLQDAVMLAWLKLFREHAPGGP